MGWLNTFGLVYMVIIMIPNIIYAIRFKDGLANKWENRRVYLLEQVGRFGCFAFMIINIPGTWFGWWSDEALAVYLIADTALVLLYCIIWIICFRRPGMFRALALSIIPSLVFLLSGILSRSVLLTASALIFAPSHILISCKNAE